MRLVRAPDNRVDHLDRAIWMTPPFDVNWRLGPEVIGMRAGLIREPSVERTLAVEPAVECVLVTGPAAELVFRGV